ncbi:MAG: serine protease, partial [Spirochaetota bacterium]
MKKLTLFTLVFFLFSVNTQAKRKRRTVRKRSGTSIYTQLKKSIVQVKTTTKRYNYYNPWRLKKPASYDGVGVVVSQSTILVFTALVENHTLVEVKKHSSYKLFPAEVIKKDYESNLSLLKVKDKSFFKDLKPIRFSKQIPLGKPISITQLDNSGALQKAFGKTTNMDMERYPFGYTELPYVNITSEE